MVSNCPVVCILTNWTAIIVGFLTVQRLPSSILFSFWILGGFNLAPSFSFREPPIRVTTNKYAYVRKVKDDLTSPISHNYLNSSLLYGQLSEEKGWRVTLLTHAQQDGTKVVKFQNSRFPAHLQHTCGYARAKYVERHFSACKDYSKCAQCNST